MLLYKDKISGDEIFTDIYTFKVVDDIVYEIVGEYITESTSTKGINTGANASAEEATEETEEGSQTGINVILKNRLQATGFNKKSYTTYIKGYMKSIKEKLAEDNPDRVDAFVEKSSAYVKKVLANFKKGTEEKPFYEFYTGDSGDPEGMVVLVEHRTVKDNQDKDVEVPILIMFKDGFEVEKL